MRVVVTCQFGKIDVPSDRLHGAVVRTGQNRVDILQWRQHPEHLGQRCSGILVQEVVDLQINDWSLRKDPLRPSHHLQITPFDINLDKIHADIPSNLLVKTNAFDFDGVGFIGFLSILSREDRVAAITSQKGHALTLVTQGKRSDDSVRALIERQVLLDYGGVFRQSFPRPHTACGSHCLRENDGEAPMMGTAIGYFHALSDMGQAPGRFSRVVALTAIVPRLGDRIGNP